jgi:mannose-6-phosphate isomerase-like protein (cupin superfamily)
MKKLIALMLLVPLVGAEPTGYKYWSAAHLMSFTQSLAHKGDGKTSLESLGNFGADRAVMVHRNASGVAELHERDADLMVIVSGAATLVVGGEMPGAKNTAPGEMRAPAVRSGASQKIGPGDILHIPPRTPHQLLLDSGAQLTYFTLKVKE